MNYEVPECQGFPGLDEDLRALSGYYFSPELHELLLREGDGGGGAGSSLTRQSPSLINLPPSSPLPTYYTTDNPSGEVILNDAEMASWLCQIDEQKAPDDHEPRDTVTATTTAKSEGGNTVPSSCGTASVGSLTAGVVAAGAAECRRGRSRSGRRRSCSGKAAEQRRRDKMNDKMRTLQQLIPRCSKTDKVTMLEEVIKYMKSLQHQLQVMSATKTTPTFPPSCIRLAGWQAPAMMLPRYPVFPVVYACSHHGTPLRLSAPAPHTRRHQEEPARSSGG